MSRALPVRNQISHLAGRVNWRLLPVQSGVLATLACIPLWKRMPYAPGTYAPLYAAGFLITLPMLWTILTWAAVGLPGLGALRRDRVRLLWAVALLALTAWMHLSVNWSFMAGYNQANVARSAAVQFTLLAAWALATACAGPPARIVASIVIVGAVWSGALGGIQIARQSSIGLRILGEFSLDPSLPGVSVLQSGGERWLRPYGLLPHPNVLAGLLAVGLIMAGAWILSPQRRLRWVGGLAAVFILWALLTTFSRAAWLGFAAGAVALLPLVPKRLIHWRIVIITAMAGMLVCAVFVLSYRSLLLARVGASESIEMRSVADRLVFSLFAYRAATENRQNTIFGIGAGNFPWRSSYYLVETDYDLQGNNVHHIWLSAFVETGLVGYAALVTAVIAGIEAALRQIKQAEMRRAASPQPGTPAAQSNTSQDRAARAVLTAGAIALALIGLFDHYPWTMLQFQTLWWGLIATAGRPESPFNHTLDQSSPERMSSI